MNPVTPNDINFLPDWYRKQRMARARVKRQITLVLFMLIGMAVLWSLTRDQRNELLLYRDALRQQAMAAENQLLEVNKLQNAKADLARQTRLFRKLARPIGFAQIDAAIGAMTPQAICLSQLTQKVEQQTRTRLVKAAGMPEGAKPTPITETYPVVSIELEGYAPTNVEIANYIGQLAGCNMFRNVKMVYSREAKVDNAITRQFKLSMEVPLDREYRMESAEEVAHVNVD